MRKFSENNKELLYESIFSKIETKLKNDNKEVIKDILDMVEKSIEKHLNASLRKENFELEQLTSGLKYPEIIVASVNEKNRAVQQAQQAENELKVVQAEAQKKVTAAQAEAESYKLKTQSLTPSILKQMWIDKWDGKLPTVSSNGGMMLNLNDLK